MDETQTAEPVETDEAQTTPETPEEAPEAPETEAETFPRAYVEKLRAEAAEARNKAKRVDALAREVFVSRVAATHRLADPADLPFDEAILDDPARLDAALDELLAAHPHYAARTPRGSVGQGTVSGASSTVDLAGMLRARA